MRIAYFSPLPPKRTGIATYSKHLLPALASKAEVEVFDHGEIENVGFQVHDYESQPSLLAMADDCDACIYHIGNNPFFHSRIREVASRRPGVVVLHDAVLYFLAAGRGIGGLLREMQTCSSEPSASLAKSLSFLDDVPDGDLLRHPHPEESPLLRRVLTSARMLIVHGETTVRLAREGGYEGPIRSIPHLVYPNALAEAHKTDPTQTRAMYGIGPSEFLVGSFGFLAKTKRLDTLMQAIAILVERKIPVKLLLVGIGEDVLPLINSSGLGDLVVQPGFVDDAEFQHLLACVDCVVNLRYPSMGEASGSLMQALAHDKPCIVTDHGWFAELPDGLVHKVSHGPNEIQEVVDSLVIIAESQKDAKDLGMKAGAYFRERHHPDYVASLYLEAVAEMVNIPTNNLRFSGPGIDSASLTKDYFAERTRQIMTDIDRHAEIGFVHRHM